MRTRTFFQSLARLFPLALVLFGPWFFATLAHADSTSLSFHVIFADFDGDNRLDQAHLLSHGSHKQIHIHFEQSSKTLSFDAGISDPGSLISGDIDHDGDADLVWLSRTSSLRIVFWRGDGHGNFTAITDPALQSEFVEAFLYRSQGWRPSHEPTANDLDGFLSDDGLDALQTAGDWVPYLVLSRNRISRQTVSTVSSPFLFVLQKRGPPSVS